MYLIKVLIYTSAKSEILYDNILCVKDSYIFIELLNTDFKIFRFYKSQLHSVSIKID